MLHRFVPPHRTGTVLAASCLLVVAGCGNDSAGSSKYDDSGVPTTDAASTDSVVKDAAVKDSGIGNLDGSNDSDTCVPRTCSELGKNCGAPSDGCGGWLDCGSCTDPEICGGAGTPNVCGGVGPLSLSRDIVHVPVSGTITRDGELIASTDCEFVGFTEVTLGLTVQTHLECEFTDTGWNFSTMLYPGTYRVKVYKQDNAWSNVHRATTIPEFVVVEEEPVTDLKLDISLVNVSGAITVNGATTKEHCSTSGYRSSYLSWYDETIEYDFEMDIHCSTENGWTYSGMIPAGTYRVSVVPYWSASFPPGGVKEVAASVEVEPRSESLHQDFDIAVPPVSGWVRRGDFTDEQCANTTIELRDADGNTKYAMPVSCDETDEWAFDTDYVKPRTYQVVFIGPLGGVEIMPALDVVDEPVELTVDTPQVVSATARVTLNDEPAVVNEGDSPLSFKEVNSGETHSFTAECSGDSCTLKADLYAGQYTAKFSDVVNGEWSELFLTEPIEINESNKDLALEFTGVSSTIYITYNGEHVVGHTCTTTSETTGRRTNVSLHNVESGIETLDDVTCDTSKGWLFSALLSPVTYRPTIDADFAGSPFEGGRIQSTADLSIEVGKSEYAIDFPGVITVSGEITRNDQSILSAENCELQHVRFQNLENDSSEEVSITCDATQGWRFTAELLQGTYDISVVTDDDDRVPRLDFELPPIAYTIVSGLSLQEERSDLTINARTRQVDLRLTREGRSLGDDTCTYQNYDTDYGETIYSYAYFISHTTEEVLERTIRCGDGDWRASVLLYPDTYRVIVAPEANSELAPGYILVQEELQIQ